MKRCFKCKETLPLSDFYKHPQMGDGHLGKCKVCACRDARAHHRARMQDAEWVEAQRARGREKHRRLYSTGQVWVSPHGAPGRKKLVAGILSRAVRMGRVEKPGACSRCGATGRIEGHHHDYSLPLDVEWLCPKCHRIHHFAKKESA